MFFSATVIPALYTTLKKYAAVIAYFSVLIGVYSLIEVF
jgi:hypothetical protein